MATTIACSEIIALNDHLEIQYQREAGYRGTWWAVLLSSSLHTLPFSAVAASSADGIGSAAAIRVECSDSMVF